MEPDARASAGIAVRVEDVRNEMDRREIFNIAAIAVGNVVFQDDLLALLENSSPNECPPLREWRTSYVPTAQDPLGTRVSHEITWEGFEYMAYLTVSLNPELGSHELEIIGWPDGILKTPYALRPQHIRIARIHCDSIQSAEEAAVHAVSYPEEFFRSNQGARK